MQNKTFLLAALEQVMAHIGFRSIVAAAIPGLEATITDFTAFWLLVQFKRWFYFEAALRNLLTTLCRRYLSLSKCDILCVAGLLLQFFAVASWWIWAYSVVQAVLLLKRNATIFSIHGQVKRNGQVTATATLLRLDLTFLNSCIAQYLCWGSAQLWWYSLLAAPVQLSILRCTIFAERLLEVGRRGARSPPLLTSAVQWYIAFSLFRRNWAIHLLIHRFH